MEEPQQNVTGVKKYFKRQNIELSFHRIAIQGLSGMAQGLFASLLIGTIIKTIGTYIPGDVGAFLLQVADFTGKVQGPVMALAIGYSLQCPPYVLYSLATVGFAAASLGGGGGPLAVYIVALIAAFFGKLVSKRTPVDLIVTPTVTILSGCLLSIFLAPAIGQFALWLGSIIQSATLQQPFFMGVIIAVLMGIILTLPISSAAICAAFHLVGLAGGAAVAGCCAHMVGFAVLSYRENKLNGLASVGLGTSMLYMPNLLKKPILWLPPVIASAVTGPLATCLFKLQMNGAAISSGMGTCGLVGPIGVWSGWFTPSEDALAAGLSAVTPGVIDWIGLILICFVLPAVLTWLVGAFMRKKGWIQDGDLKLEL